MENQTIKKFHRRTSAPSRRPERVVLRCEHHCSSPGPSAPLAPWRMARRLDRPAPARITSRVRYRQTSAERIADGNRSDFCSTSPRTAPWCILSYCMNQSSEDPDRRSSQGQGYQSTREVGTRCTSDRPGTRL